MVHRAAAAAEALAGEIDIELIDLRSIVPWDIETVLASVRKTGRLLVVHEANTQFGVGAEIVRRVTEEAFPRLRCARWSTGVRRRPCRLPTCSRAPPCRSRRRSWPRRDE